MHPIKLTISFTALSFFPISPPSLGYILFCLPVFPLQLYWLGQSSCSCIAFVLTTFSSTMMMEDVGSSEISPYLTKCASGNRYIHTNNCHENSKQKTTTVSSIITTSKHFCTFITMLSPLTKYRIMQCTACTQGHDEENHDLFSTLIIVFPYS